MLKSIGLSFILILLIGQPVQSGLFFDWQQLETEHFRVYFQAGRESQANQAAVIAEEIHQELTAFLDYEPEKKTELILYDKRDAGAGWASVAWDRRIGIYLGSVDLERGFGDFESWLRLVIAHEYAHILQLTLPPQKLWPWGWLSHLIPPTLFQPYWFIEGFAITVETMLTEGGRADSTVIENRIRAQADAEQLYHFDQIQGLFNLESWPGPSAAYNYGGRFMSYLSDIYGSDLIVEMARRYPENPFRGFTGWFNYLTGDDLQEVYQDWQQSMASDERPPELNTLTSAWGYNQNPAADPNEDRLVYFHQGHLFPSLRLWSEDGDEHLLSAAGVQGGRPAWSPDGNQIALARLEPEGLKEIYHQIYIYDLEIEEEEQITTGRGGRYPAWSSTGQLAYVENVAGGNRVVLYEPETGNREVLFFDREELQYGTLAWDPDGEKLAVEIFKEGGPRGFWIFDQQSGYLETFFVQEGSLRRPVWSRDGSFLYTIGKIGGQPQVLAFDYESDEFWQVTSYSYGTFDLAPGIDYDYFVVLTAEGYQIKKERIPREEWKPLDLTLFVPEEDEELREARETRFSSRDYPLLNKLRPRLVLPWSRGGLAGVNMIGWDPLDLIYYEASLGMGFLIPPVYSFFAGIYPDKGHIALLETIAEGGWASRVGGRELDPPRRFDGGQLLLHLPVKHEYFEVGVLRLGGGLYHFPDFIFPGLHLGWTQQLIRGQDRFNLNLGYSLDGSAWYLEGWEADLMGRVFLDLGLGEGREMNFISLGGLAPGYSRVQTGMRSYVEDLKGDSILLSRLEYNQRLLDIKRGRGELPFFLDSLQARPYLETGTAWSGGELETRLGAGLEAVLDIQLLHGRLPLELIGGVAYNYDDQLHGYLRFDLGGFEQTLGEKFFRSPVDRDN